MVKSLLFTTCKRSELYEDEGEIRTETARHLFRVAAGLESPFLGETAILGQLKRSYLDAQKEGKLSPNLNKLFQTAICVGHRVRKETGISRGAVSYAQVTVEILSAELSALEDKEIVIIGVNQMTESIVRFLLRKGAKNITLLNRTVEKAQTLAEKYALKFGAIAKSNFDADVVISATASPDYIIKSEDVEDGRERLFFDLANPKDIEESVAEKRGVKLFDLEKIENHARENFLGREREVEKCNAIIEEELKKLLAWQDFYKSRREVV